MKDKEFEELWENPEGDLKEYTKALVDIMESKPDNIKPILKALVEVFSEVNSFVQYLDETKLAFEDYKKWHNETFLKHRHKDRQIVVPEKAVEG